MVYVVDTVQVEPQDAPTYMGAVEAQGVPVMTDAGARFVSCWGTSADLGEAVSITTVWACQDHVAWNDIRKNMVLDPRWHELSITLAELRTGGNRRFYYPAPFSPDV